MHQTRSIVSVAVLAALAVAPAAAQRAIHSFHGSQAGAGFGRALAATDDQDGDGLPELVVGEPGYSLGNRSATGAARVVSVGSGRTLAVTLGFQAGDGLGTTVAAVGDVDGDGFADFAASAPTAGAQDHGLVRIASGRSGLPIVEVTGEDRSEFGTALCAVGDQDGDGRAEFVVGSPHNSNVRPMGRVQVFDHRGAALFQVSGSNHSRLGHGLAALGDVTGDGLADYVVGEPDRGGSSTGSGRVAVYRANAGGGAAQVWEVTVSQVNGTHLGRVVAAAGDVDGDGHQDVLVGDARQRVRILSGVDGRLLAHVSDPAFVGDQVLAGIGDWDGDGGPDFAVGVPTADGSRGQVIVYSANPLRRLAVLVGEPASSFGAALAGLGDVDGDGRDDFAVGAPGFVSQGAVLGRVSVHAWDVAATASTFGSGCGGVLGTPALGVDSAPRLGTRCTLRCGNLRPLYPALWWLGTSATRFGATPLPLELGGLGFPGCHLLVSVDASAAQVPATDTARLTLDLPTDPRLAGLRLFAQLAQAEPTAPHGLVVSDGLELTLGNR